MMLMNPLEISTLEVEVNEFSLEFTKNIEGKRRTYIKKNIVKNRIAFTSYSWSSSL